MSNALALVRSLAFLAWMVVTVIPIALSVLVASIVQRGAPLYWMCVTWLRLVIGGARWICGVRYRVQGMADTLEYSNVAFPSHRFEPELVDELREFCPSLLEDSGDALVIRHVYMPATPRRSCSRTAACRPPTCWPRRAWA